MATKAKRTMESKEIDLDLQVDPDNLDREWIGQPRMYFRYAEELATARKIWDMAKVELELVKAELSLSIRSDPEKFGLAKTTESSISATVLLQPVYVKAQREVIELKYLMEVLSSAVTSLDHRKSTLQNMVQLRLANYYSKPVAPEGAKDRMDEAEKRAVRKRNRERE